MRLLLDTHIFLWFIKSDPQLGPTTAAFIRDPDHEVYLSVASIWEAVIKYKIGKLELAGPPTSYLPEKRELHRIASVPVVEADLRALESLPLHHRDPFDRLLVSQALHHGFTLVTDDEGLTHYPAPRLDATR